VGTALVVGRPVAPVDAPAGTRAAVLALAAGAALVTAVGPTAAAVSAVLDAALAAG
jgi:hypothetical protein